jgi:hypothetical protein
MDRNDTAPHSSAYAANMNGVAAVDRALAIVQALEQARRPLSLREISDATALYKSGILRLVVSLERAQLVVKRADGAYTLGPLAFRLGKAYDANAPLEATLKPLMERLVREGMESPSFHVQHNARTRLCVLRVDSLHSTLDRVRVGDLLPLSAGAPGKVLRSAPPERCCSCPSVNATRSARRWRARSTARVASCSGRCRCQVRWTASTPTPCRPWGQRCCRPAKKPAPAWAGSGRRRPEWARPRPLTGSSGLSGFFSSFPARAASKAARQG